LPKADTYNVDKWPFSRFEPKTYEPKVRKPVHLITTVGQFVKDRYKVSAPKAPANKPAIMLTFFTLISTEHLNALYYVKIVAKIKDYV